MSTLGESSPDKRAHRPIDPPHELTAEDSDTAVKLTPQVYAQRVVAFSSRSAADSIYTGRHYAVLGRWLNSIYHPSNSSTRNQTPQDSSLGFLVVQELGSQGRGREKVFKSPEGLWEDDAVSPKTSGPKHFVFMRGYPSPSWLNTVGAKFFVDPEFFLRHLDGLDARRTSDTPYLPSLAASGQIVHLRIPTIGSWNDHAATSSVRELRENCEKSMSTYTDQLFPRDNIDPCYPIVRRFIVHDKHNFTIEQLISLCVSFKGTNWTGLAWLDNGNDLSTTLDGPWRDGRQNAWGVTLHPVIQHRRLLAIRNPYARQAEAGTRTSPRFHQSASHLPFEFDSSLRPEVMELDPFYAMNGIFRFAAAAQSQFLEMMRRKIKASVASASPDSIGDLSRAKDVLGEQARQVQDNLDVIKSRGGRGWPKAQDDRLVQEAEAVADTLQAEYEHLLRSMTQLSLECSESVSILMSDAQYHEAQKGIAQGNAVIKLTIIAFVFVPLSFTTSFFGMNFNELGDKSIWIWFAVSVPVLTLCLLLWTTDFSKTWSRIRRFRWAK